MEVLLRMDEKRTIFRMRSINDNTLKAFFNDEVYASSPLKFNDPYDVLACYDKDKLYEYFDSDKIANEWCKAKEKIYPLINGIALNTMHQLREQLAIACFCNDVKKEIMWSHYAGNGTGFALEYDFDEVNAAISSYVRKNFESYKENNIFKNCSFKLEDVN